MEVEKTIDKFYDMLTKNKIRIEKLNSMIINDTHNPFETLCPNNTDILLGSYINTNCYLSSSINAYRYKLDYENSFGYYKDKMIKQIDKINIINVENAKDKLTKTLVYMQLITINIDDITNHVFKFLSNDVNHLIKI